MGLRCAFCHDDLSAAPAPCPGCGTLLHADCWPLARGCPSLGCSTRARAVDAGRSTVQPGPRRASAWARRPRAWLALALLAGAGWLYLRNQPVWTLETHACDAEELAFSADGARLFARCGLGLRIADVAEGRWTHYPDVGGGEPGLAVSPGGDLVAAGRWVWEVEQLRMTPPAHHAGPLPGHAAAWSPDGAQIACVGHDGAVRLATLSGVVTRVLTPPRAPGDPAQQDWLWWHDPLVRFSPDGSRLAARMPGGVRVWEATTGTLLLELRDVEPVADLRFSRDGSTLATVAQGRLVHWLVPGGIELAALPLLAASSSPWHSYGSFAISPDLRSVSCSRGSGRLPNPLETKSLDGTHRWRWTGLYTRALAYSPDGQFVAACGANTLVQLWRAD